MTDLSILIPARNEEFLSRTIDDILEHIEGDTEIIAVLDGAWADPPIPDHPLVTLIHHSESIGQRAATNEAARLSNAKYLMKVDAHCAFDQGFDVKMLSHMQDDWTMVPIMRNLHVFNWVCTSCGEKRYQGRSGPCEKCGGDCERDIVWIAKRSPQSKSYCFDPEPHFQYFRSYNKRPEGKGDLTETMSLQGSCWMLTRDKYHELNICDESWGSWGSQGIEVACKTWLSGGTVIVNHHTWYAHAFRTQGGDWGFPYPISDRQVRYTRKAAKDLFFHNKWPQQTRNLSWLLDRFWPVEEWTEDDYAEVKSRDKPNLESSTPTKAIIYYTDNQLDPKIMSACQNRLRQAAGDIPIVCVSLEPTDFGDTRVILPEERGVLTLFRQILAGLEATDADVIFFAEHDMLYHESHFEFTPERDDLFYYNENVWKVRYADGHALHYDVNQTSGLCAYRGLLVGHYRERVRRVEAEGFSRRMGFEPGTHNRKERIDDHGHSVWRSSVPNIDIRHSGNFTSSRWSKDQFRNKKYTSGWEESNSVPGWGVTKGRFCDIIEQIGGSDGMSI